MSIIDFWKRLGYYWKLWWRWSARYGLRYLLRISLRLFLLLFLVLLLVYFLLQIPAVQQWVLNRVDSALEKRMETKVDIGSLRIPFFDQLVLESFQVEGFHQDTVLYADRLEINLDVNPFTLISKGIVVEKVELTGAQLTMRRMVGEIRNSFPIIIERLFKPRQDKPKRDNGGFQLNINEIFLNQTSYKEFDEINGKNNTVYVERAYFRVEDLDFNQKLLTFQEVKVFQGHIDIFTFKSHESADSIWALRMADTTGLADTSFLTIAIDQIDFQQSKVTIINERFPHLTPLPSRVVDFKDLLVEDIDLNAEDFKFDVNLNFEGKLNGLSFRESSGFVLEQMTVDAARVTPAGFELLDLNIKTPYSEIGDTLLFIYDTYLDFLDFTNQVRMDGRLDKARVALRDIMAFAPGLNRNRFFIENRDEVLSMDGRLSGTVNDLGGNQLNITLADQSSFEGKFSSFNLAVPGSQFLDLNIQRLNTSMETAEKLFPDLVLPANFNKLGRLFFTGSFFGYFHDFVAYGSLATNLGSAEMDINLNLAEGPEKAFYSGRLALKEFDLATWTDNEDFGLLSAVSTIENGQGLTGASVNATLSSQIDTFTFRDYTYKNAEFSGTLNKNLLDGVFGIQDEHIDFQFEGRLNFLRPVHSYRFNAQLNRLAFKPLNLSEKDFVVSGGIQLDLRNNLETQNVTGQTTLKEVLVVVDQDQEIDLGDIVGASVIDSVSNEKTVTLNADFFNGSVKGDFYLGELVKVYYDYFQRYQPQIAHRLALKPVDTLKTKAFAWDLKVLETKGLEKLLHPDLKPFDGLTFTGEFDRATDLSEAFLNVPTFGFKGWAFTDIDVVMKTNESYLDLIAGVAQTVVNEKQSFEPVKLNALFHRDTANFLAIYAERDQPILDEFSLSGQWYPKDSTAFVVQLDTTNLALFQQTWHMESDNAIEVYPDSIYIRKFQMSNTANAQQLQLRNFGSKGLALLFNEAPFSQIDEWWDYEPLDFGGEYDVEVRVADLFNLQGFSGLISSDTLYINDDDWGALRVDFLLPDLKNKLNTYMTLTKDTMQLIAEGYYNLADIVETPKESKNKAKHFDYQVELAAFPMGLAEYFLGNTVSNTVGSVGAKFRLEGFPGDPKISGNMYATDGAVTIDYLKTRYTFDNSVVRINNEMFDASNTILKDRLGNQAILYGGVTHEKLKKLGFNAVLVTPKFLALDTKAGDNDLFYGRAIGNGRITFTGSFQQPNIYVDAETSTGTKLIIPLDSDQEKQELSFIKFVDKQKTNISSEVSAKDQPEILKGVSLEMDLAITEETDMELVFDRQAGDIIRGNGRGNIRILVPRVGDFQMFGNYAIESGDYLFTLYNLVNKKFQIERGGQIQWDGDPFGATIDIEAAYSDINAPVANLIQEYLTTARSDLQANASLPTQVDLKMLLRGKLMNPVITFEIELPQLRGILETYATNKLRLLERDQNELYKQVFGLITMGQFIPSEFDFRGAGNNIIYNTLSEFVSNQLSLLITELFSEFIDDGSVLSGIDFDINYNPSQQVSIDGQNISAGEELEVKLRQDFFNDRLSIVIGGNIDLGGNLSAAPESSGAFVGNDLVIEYVLNPDRSLKLKIYQRLLPNIGGGRRLQLGTGISFRREFENFGEFWDSFKKDVNKQQKNK